MTRSVVFAVEHLLAKVARGDLILAPNQIKERVKAYARERQAKIDENWLNRENADEATDETIQGILIDRPQLLGATIHYGTYGHPGFRKLRRSLAKFL